MDEETKPRSVWIKVMWLVVNLWLFSAVGYSIGRALGYWD
jgi:hypothetical protein